MASKTKQVTIGEAFLMFDAICDEIDENGAASFKARKPLEYYDLFVSWANWNRDTIKIMGDTLENDI